MSKQQLPCPPCLASALNHLGFGRCRQHRQRQRQRQFISLDRESVSILGTPQLTPLPLYPAHSPLTPLGYFTVALPLLELASRAAHISLACQHLCSSDHVFDTSTGGQVGVASGRGTRVAQQLVETLATTDPVHCCYLK